MKKSFLEPKFPKKISKVLKISKVPKISKRERYKGLRETQILLSEGTQSIENLESTQSIAEEQKIPGFIKRKIRLDAKVKKRNLERSKNQDFKIPGVKEIAIYPKEKCIIPGCARYAVGKDTVCKIHGGDPVIKENLLKNEEIPDYLQFKTKYDPATHPIRYIELARLGKSESEIASEFNVSKADIRDWVQNFLEFNTAYEIGQTLYEAWWQEKGKDNLNDNRFNTTLFRYLTMNNLGWSEKSESKNLNVTAGVLVTPGQSTENEWEKKYGKKDKKF